MRSTTGPPQNMAKATWWYHHIIWFLPPLPRLFSDHTKPAHSLSRPPDMVGSSGWSGGRVSWIWLRLT